MILRGAVATAGAVQGPALVSRTPFNPLAQMIGGVIEGASILCAEDRVSDIHGSTLTGQILCVPLLVGSTSAGAIWEHVARTGSGPHALLIAGPIDPLTAASMAVVAEWTSQPIVCIASLGEELLEIPVGVTLHVRADGSVAVGDRAHST